MASALRASGDLNPNAMRVMSRTLVFTDSVRPLARLHARSRPGWTGVLDDRSLQFHEGRDPASAGAAGRRQRIAPISARFFSAVAAYYDTERPRTSSTETVFVVLKGPRRGQPLSAAGLDEIIEGARKRAVLTHLTCHQLRHTVSPGSVRPGWRW